MSSGRKMTATLAVVALGLAIIAIPARAQIENKTVDFTTPAKPFSVDLSKFGPPVMENGTIKVPAITWGGDGSIIAANRGSEPNAQSIYSQKYGFKVQVALQDDFGKQIEDYVSGKSPCLRGTLDMIAMASEALSKNPALTPVVPVLLSWSSGGDGIVVRGNIKALKDLKGTRIVLQQNSPSLRLLYRVLSDANLSSSDVKIFFTRDIIAVDEDPSIIYDTPNAFRRDPSLDAAVTIAPETLDLTSGGKVGTGAERSVKGARILLSTKTANRLIADVVAFRKDFADGMPDVVDGFARGTIMGMEELLREHAAAGQGTSSARYEEITRQMAQLFFQTDVNKDTIAMLGDVSIAGLSENRKFFKDKRYSASFDRTWNSAQEVLQGEGYLTRILPPDGFKKAADYDAIEAALGGAAAQTQSFTLGADRARKAAESSGSSALFSHAFKFGLNETTFDPGKYQAVFEQIQELATVYGGAVIEIVGHSDPYQIRKLEAKSAPLPILNRVKQSATILSKRRANAVKAALVKGGFQIVEEQLITSGSGANQPVFPNPKSKEQQQENMRVEVKVINIESEAWIGE